MKWDILLYFRIAKKLPVGKQPSQHKAQSDNPVAQGRLQKEDCVLLLEHTKRFSDAECTDDHVDQTHEGHSPLQQ